jgi:hypothetical protein
MKVTAGLFRQKMILYKKPTYPNPWQCDPNQKNNRPVMFARDEDHAEQLRQRMKRRKVSIEINPAYFATVQTSEG